MPDAILNYANCFNLPVDQVKPQWIRESSAGVRRWAEAALRPAVSACEGIRLHFGDDGPIDFSYQYSDRELAVDDAHARCFEHKKKATFPSPETRFNLSEVDLTKWRLAEFSPTAITDRLRSGMESLPAADEDRRGEVDNMKTAKGPPDSKPQQWRSHHEPLHGGDDSVPEGGRSLCVRDVDSSTG